jgi:hypothetical protein
LALTGAILNADLAGSIAYSKLALTGAILNADLAGSIAYSKLALTGAILNADLAGSIAYSKLNLTGAILNADLAGSIAYSKLALTGAILNADISASAAIAYSKLALTGSILNADLAGSIAYSKLSLTGAILNADLAGSIAYSKLSLSNSILNADINSAAAIAYSKLNLATSIVNADVSASAAIAGTKISPDFGSQNVVTTGTGTFTTLAQTGNQITLDSDATGAQLVGLKSGANTNQLYLTANTTAGNGGELSLYGSTHGSKPNTIEFATAGNFVGKFDSSGNFYSLLGNIAISALGKTLTIAEGSNAKMGTAVLVTGTKVVSTTAVTANSRIFLTSNTDGGTPGWLRVSARTAGTSFTITSSSGTDTSTVAWVIFEPS